jgi:PDZ domain
MNRKLSLLSVGLCVVVSVTDQASAQTPDLQKQLQEAFQRAAAAQAQPGVRGGRSQLRWGGVRLEKPSPELQAQLGLEEKVGLVVAAVDPTSAGDKAGLKVNDVLLKIGATPVPNDVAGFAKLVKDQKADDPVDLVVIRKGKEETLKGAKMPAQVQNTVVGGGVGRLPGIVGPRIPPLQINPLLMPGKLDKLHMEMTVNGAKVVRDQDGDKFTGSYVKDELKINVAGKIENGQNKISEITVQQGKETSKYTTVNDVPAQHRPMIQQLLPSPFANLMTLPFPDMPAFPAFPMIPGIDD